MTCTRTLIREAPHRYTSFQCPTATLELRLGNPDEQNVSTCRLHPTRPMMALKSTEGDERPVTSLRGRTSYWW